MKRRTKVLTAALSIVLMFALLAGSAMALPVDGIASSAEDLQDELNIGWGDSKTITLAADIDYYEPTSWVHRFYTFNLNNHILNMINSNQLKVIWGSLELTGEGEFNVTDGGIVAFLSDHVMVTNVTSNDVGVEAAISNVTVNGTINAPVYIRVDEADKVKNDGVPGTGEDQGFLIYTGGESTVRVKDPMVPSCDWYSVSYHPNGGLGSVALDMNRYYRGSKVKLSTGEGITRPGYKFVGWELRDGTPVTDPFIMGENDVTLFATWRAK